MAKKKATQQLSSEELFKLAEERRQEERQEQRSALKSELDALRQQKRELLATHKKEVNALDKQIQKIRNKMSPSGASHRAGRSGSISTNILEILGANGQMATQDIQQALANQGIVAKNLSQALAYLKSQGKIGSPKRSVYTIA